MLHTLVELDYRASGAYKQIDKVVWGWGFVRIWHSGSLGKGWVFFLPFRDAREGKAFGISINLKAIRWNRFGILHDKRALPWVYGVDSTNWVTVGQRQWGNKNKIDCGIWVGELLEWLGLPLMGNLKISLSLFGVRTSDNGKIGSPSVVTDVEVSQSKRKWKRNEDLLDMVNSIQRSTNIGKGTTQSLLDCWFICIFHPSSGAVITTILLAVVGRLMMPSCKLFFSSTERCPRFPNREKRHLVQGENEDGETNAIQFAHLHQAGGRF